MPGTLVHIFDLRVVHVVLRTLCIWGSQLWQCRCAWRWCCQTACLRLIWVWAWYELLQWNDVKFYLMFPGWPLCSIRIVGPICTLWQLTSCRPPWIHVYPFEEKRLFIRRDPFALTTSTIEQLQPQVSDERSDEAGGQVWNNTPPPQPTAMKCVRQE